MVTHYPQLLQCLLVMVRWMYCVMLLLFCIRVLFICYVLLVLAVPFLLNMFNPVQWLHLANCLEILLTMDVDCQLQLVSTSINVYKFAFADNKLPT